MNRTISLFLVAIALPILSFAQIRLDPGLMQAGLEAISASTLTNAQVVNYSKQAIKEMDSKNPVAPASDPYAQRLARIVARHKTVSGLPINYKVYKVADVNAFATADGSVRVFKGLMDIMSDSELLAIMGHEIGHVINEDSRDAMKSALRRSAVRNAVASQSGSLGQLSRSQLGGLADQMLGASFSRKQETEADDYGYSFLKKNGYSVMALASSFEKLAKLGGGGGNKVTAILSSHPDSQSRAKRIRDRAKRDGLTR